MYIQTIKLQILMLQKNSTPGKLGNFCQHVPNYIGIITEQIDFT